MKFTNLVKRTTTYYADRLPDEVEACFGVRLFNITEDDGKCIIEVAEDNLNDECVYATS